MTIEQLKVLVALWGHHGHNGDWVDSLDLAVEVIADPKHYLEITSPLAALERRGLVEQRWDPSGPIDLTRRSQYRLVVTAFVDQRDSIADFILTHLTAATTKLTTGEVAA